MKGFVELSKMLRNTKSLTGLPGQLHCPHDFSNHPLLIDPCGLYLSLTFLLIDLKKKTVRFYFVEIYGNIY